MTGRSLLAWPGVPIALASAALFGASTPFVKLLLGGGLDPWLLAGLLYLGAGLGLGLMALARGGGIEAPLRRRDLPRLALITTIGGILGPVLLMFGLAQTSASTASLLLNLEGLATMGIAWLLFREPVDGRLLLGAAAILAGAVMLSWQGGPAAFGWGAAAVVSACLAWGLDNNLALLGGVLLPLPASVAGAMAIGLLGYGASLVLFVLALRHLGTARTAAYFSCAPFLGAALAVFMLGEPRLSACVRTT